MQHLSKSSGPSEVNQVSSGRDLDRMVRAANPTKRALLAADIEAGRVIIEKPTARQARVLARANIPYANAARKLSPTERAACRIGRLNLAEKARERRPISDAKLDKLIGKIGAGRMMAALDRYTSPELPLVAAK
jgi:hypothetical protein